MSAKIPQKQKKSTAVIKDDIEKKIWKDTKTEKKQVAWEETIRLQFACMCVCIRRVLALIYGYDHGLGYTLPVVLH